ncbi:sphingosine 1-phosphate receptor 3a [Paramormyrops kingsleyae]|uniref:Sphingosine-1-phosphate receptor 3a n=1 Tax=Paramormyrops kingsleyae TaxID=1676925 RepID=A0A3B3TBH2_9TELE|nr:sphingosine 1-phosphate receptor 3-like [Paramormyrops kingsleyae]
MEATIEEGMNLVIVNHYNHSGKWERPRGTGTCKTTLVLIICVLIVLENVTVLLALCRHKRFHSRMYLLIGNLALSDLLAGVAYAVNIFTSGRRTFFLTPTQWLAREGSMFVALSASTFSLLAIGIERHMTMVRRRPSETAGRGRLLGLLGACWAVSVLLGALPSLGWNCQGHLEACSTVLPLYDKSYVAFCISIFSALLAAIVVLYTRIYRLVTSSGRRLGGSRPSECSLVLLRTVVIVLGVFVVCWAPLFLLLLLDVGCSPERCPVLYQEDWFIALAVLNSALNPLIYTLTSRELRTAFFRVLCCSQAQLEATPPIEGPPNLVAIIPTGENSKSSAGGPGAAVSGLTKSKISTPLSSSLPHPGPSSPTLLHPSGPAELLSAVLVKAGALPSLSKF